MHPRRVQLESLNILLGKFRQSNFGARFREATKTRKRPNGAELGRRQLAEARCSCIKKRNASQCDCQLCTYVEDNLVRWHKARSGWHAANLQRSGGKPCECHIHRVNPLAEMIEEEEAMVWRAACEEATEPRDEVTSRWEAACTGAHLIRKQRARAASYDGMSASTQKLREALLPCGRKSYPEYSVTGEAVFHTYHRACAADNCPRRIFKPKDACGWEHVFGADCPIESGNSKDANFSWFVWEQRLRGTDADGKPVYSPEWVPRQGTRGQFLSEFRPKVRQWLEHTWRKSFLSHSLRLIEDKRSGRHIVALRGRLKGPLLLAETMQIVFRWVEKQQLAVVESGEVTAVRLWQVASWAAIARASNVGVAALQPNADELARLQLAERAYSALSNTVRVQCDYASQLETKRAHTATCATMERHNLEVCVAGFSPYVEAVRSARFSRKQPRERSVFKQHVFVFFAFHKAGYKPNARSHNVVQEDIDHYLKYGSFLRGEWFEGGRRLPGGPMGAKRLPLPDGLCEALQKPPLLPGYNRRLEVTDGCPNQYDYGTNHHQTAEWRTKTATWPEAVARGGDQGIIRLHVKLVENHGKGCCDGESNVPGFAIKEALETGKILDPGTRDLVLYCAQHRQSPSVDKRAKDAWEAVTKYFWGHFDTAAFSKSAVPDAQARGWHCNDQHVYLGLCADQNKAIHDGPILTGGMYCGCDPCILFDFSNCKMREQVVCQLYRNVCL